MPVDSNLLVIEAWAGAIAGTRETSLFGHLCLPGRHPKGVTRGTYG